MCKNMLYQLSNWKKKRKKKKRKKKCNMKYKTKLLLNEINIYLLSNRKLKTNHSGTVFYVLLTLSFSSLFGARHYEKVTGFGKDYHNITIPCSYVQRQNFSLFFFFLIITKANFHHHINQY